MFGSTRLRNYFITGVLVIAPTAVSIWLLYRAFKWVDDLLDNRIEDLLGRDYAVPGVGFITVVAIILVVGFLTSGYLGSRLLRVWELIVSTIPLMNRIYPAVKQIGSALLTDTQGVFRDVVLIEYPRRGIYSLAFTTKRPPSFIQRHVRPELMSIFLPTTPNPTSGVFLMVPAAELIHLDIEVEDAIKLIISGGMVTPEMAPGQPVEATELPADAGDAGVADADAGVADAGVADAGVTDADAGVTDAGVTDAGVTDADAGARREDEPPRGAGAPSADERGRARRGGGGRGGRRGGRGRRGRGGGDNPPPRERPRQTRRSW